MHRPTALLLILAACSTPRAGSGSRTDRCDELAAHVYVAAEGREDDRKGPTVAAIADACRNDGWSDELIACLRGNDDLKGDTRCKPLLSETQGRNLERAFEVTKDEAAMARASAPAASSYSCFSYYNQASRNRQAVCAQDCADRYTGMAQLREAKLATDFTECAAVPSVWCFLWGETETCLTTQADCELRRESLSRPEKQYDPCVEQR